jgi:hypothetical protein
MVSDADAVADVAPASPHARDTAVRARYVDGMRGGTAAIAYVVVLIGCAPSSTSIDAGANAACGEPPGLVCGASDPAGRASWCAATVNPPGCYFCPGPFETCSRVRGQWCEQADPCGTPPCWLATYPCMDAGHADASADADGSNRALDATTE